MVFERVVAQLLDIRGSGGLLQYGMIHLGQYVTISHLNQAPFVFGLLLFFLGAQHRGVLIDEPGAVAGADP